MLTSDIAAEMQTRLLAIVSGNSTGIEDNTYFYTPVAVLRGRHLLDENMTIFPVYSVIRGAHSDPNYEQSRRVFTSDLSMSVEGIVKISDRDTPENDAENAIADVVAAILGPRDNKLGGLCIRSDWTSDEIEISQAATVAYFEVVFSVTIGRRRGGLGYKAP